MQGSSGMNLTLGCSNIQPVFLSIIVLICVRSVSCVLSMNLAHQHYPGAMDTFCRPPHQSCIRNIDKIRYDKAGKLGLGHGRGGRHDRRAGI